MVDIADLTLAASLMADPARANMLSALKDEGALSATDLAHVAGVAPNTASGHLAKLREAGLVSVHRSGRLRYYRLAGSQVAAILEALEALAGQIAPAKLATVRGGTELRFARSCYDHLAGRLAVELADALVGRGILRRSSSGFALRPDGREALADLGVDMKGLDSRRRPLLQCCPDWSEGRVHLGGALAAKLLDHFCEQGWLIRTKGKRAVLLSPAGKRALRRHFGIEVACR
jgi:DNA-binding transcriptional ArsR family regulator